MFFGRVTTFYMLRVMGAKGQYVCCSGLTSSSERGVTPVYLRCREGGVVWRYPRGALRLLFKPPLPADVQDFRVCIRVIRRPDPPDLFHTLRINDTGKFNNF